MATASARAFPIPCVWRPFRLGRIGRSCRFAPRQHFSDFGYALSVRLDLLWRQLCFQSLSALVVCRFCQKRLSSPRDGGCGQSQRHSRRDKSLQASTHPNASPSRHKGLHVNPLHFDSSWFPNASDSFWKYALHHWICAPRPMSITGLSSSIFVSPNFGLATSSPRILYTR